MQQEELKKEELYEIRDLLERVNDSYGHDKLFGTHPRRFMDFTTRTANSAYRKMCPKLHPDNHNQNGYTTTDEKDIATECFVKLQEAKKEFNRQNENVDAVRAYLIKENQKRREEKELELEMDEEKEKSFFCEKKKKRLEKRTAHRQPPRWLDLKKNNKNGEKDIRRAEEEEEEGERRARRGNGAVEARTDAALDGIGVAS